MKSIFYKFMLTMVVFAGLLVGMVKGQEARQKWVNKKKTKYEQKKNLYNEEQVNHSLVALDDIEMATYHS